MMANSLHEQAAQAARDAVASEAAIRADLDERLARHAAAYAPVAADYAGRHFRVHASWLIGGLAVGLVAWPIISRRSRAG